MTKFQRMQKLRISLIQTSIVWEDKVRNLQIFEHKIKELAGQTDLLVFPEMFTTGFSMNSNALAEPNDGLTLQTVKRWANDYEFAVCGSFIACENRHYYNRGFFVSPDQSVFFYDKRHLFSIGQENQFFSPGNQKLIISYNGWHICLLICYDLRFPVWARNVGNEYDLLIYVANWPASRKSVWKTLLTARAIENQCYVCGVNRVGTDGMNLSYSGDSMLIDAKGNNVSNIPECEEFIETITLQKEDLDSFRAKFPAWKDGDRFMIENVFLKKNI